MIEKPNGLRKGTFELSKRTDKETVAFINQIMVLKGVQSLRETADKTGLPLAGLREWLKTGDDLMLSQKMQGRLFDHVGFDASTGAMSTDRIHHIHLEKKLFDYSDEKNVILEAVLNRLAAKLKTSFTACELVSDSLDNGSPFRRLRRFFLCTKKGKQRFYLTVKAITWASSALPEMDVPNLGGEYYGEVPQHKVGDLAEAIESFQLSTSEFDSVFFRGNKRSTFREVELLCRANNVSSDELLSALKRGLRKTYTQTKPIGVNRDLLATLERVDVSSVTDTTE